MDIGPVNAIRPIPAVRPSPPGFGNGPDSGLTGVFASEFARQQGDDHYAARQKASRGLEDEDEDAATSEETGDDLGEPPSARKPGPPASSSSVSFFA